MRTTLNVLLLAMLGVWTNFCFYGYVKLGGETGQVMLWVGILHLIIVSTGCILHIRDMMKKLKELKEQA